MALCKGCGCLARSRADTLKTWSKYNGHDLATFNTFVQGVGQDFNKIRILLWLVLIINLISVKNKFHFYFSDNYFKLYGKFSKRIFVMMGTTHKVGLMCISAIADVIFRKRCFSKIKLCTV